MTMTPCESNCFFSSNTVGRALADGVTGAVIVAFIGCLIDGTIAFVDGAVICATSITLGIVAGFLIGAAVGLLLAFLDCREDCIGVGAAAPGNADQGLTEQPAAGMTCEDAKRALAAREATVAGAEAAAYGSKIDRHAKTAVYLAVAIAATGTMWNGYVTLAGVILIPVFTLLHDALRVRMLEGGFGGIDPGGLATRRRLRDRAQERVDELCGGAASRSASGTGMDQRRAAAAGI
jgi:hypothetical protein